MAFVTNYVVVQPFRNYFMAFGHGYKLWLLTGFVDFVAG